MRIRVKVTVKLGSTEKKAHKDIVVTDDIRTVDKNRKVEEAANEIKESLIKWEYESRTL
jgi:hypothetical protein